MGMHSRILDWGYSSPPPLLPKWEKGSRIQSPSPILGEGFRVRAAFIGMHSRILDSGYSDPGSPTGSLEGDDPNAARRSR